jgi:hypothetical protein
MKFNLTKFRTGVMNYISSETKLNRFVDRAEYAHNSKIKRNKKRRALRSKQRVEVLINSVGKRTVVVLNLFFSSLIPSSLGESKVTF